MKNLVLRTVTGIVFVAVVVASILLYDVTAVPFFILMLLVAVGGTWEFLKMTGVRSAILPTILTFVAVVAVLAVPFLACTPAPEFLLLTLLFFFPVLSAAVLFRKNGEESPLRILSLCLFPLFWIALPVMMMGVIIGEMPSLLLALFIMIWLNDTLAYCAGSLFGRHKLCERISPKKTWEGFLIALVLTVAASASFAYIPYFSEAQWNLGHWLGFAGVVVLFGTLGDLVESMVNMACGVKDSGNVLPGHGGILDRFDSVLMAVPAGSLYVIFVYHLIIG